MKYNKYFKNEKNQINVMKNVIFNDINLIEKKNN